jgi:hypothetical protein
MKKIITMRTLALFVTLMALVGLATPQIAQVIKVIGVGAAVKQFAPEINRAVNRLSKHKDTNQQFTKVVPIISIGLGKSSAIGAAQVIGTRAQVQKVEAVAQPEADLFGREIRIRALIPVSSKDVIKNIRKVDGVGISGIVDLKL